MTNNPPTCVLSFTASPSTQTPIVQFTGAGTNGVTMQGFRILAASQTNTFGVSVYAAQINLNSMTFDSNWIAIRGQAAVVSARDITITNVPSSGGGIYAGWASRMTFYGSLHITGVSTTPGTDAFYVWGGSFVYVNNPVLIDGSFSLALSCADVQSNVNLEYGYQSGTTVTACNGCVIWGRGNQALCETCSNPDTCY